MTGPPDAMTGPPDAMTGPPDAMTGPPDAMTGPPDRLCLPLRFDAPSLAEEVAALPAEAWAAHFNQAIYHGDWSGVALRGPAGGPAGRRADLYPDPAASTFADTEMASRCPRLMQAVAALRCPLTSVRLLALGPGARIDEHRDYWLAYADGEVRLHVPLVTDPAVEFVLDGAAVPMAAGECWYLNLNLPHRVANGSHRRRVHLVIDCVVDAWLADLFSHAVAVGNDLHSATAPE